VEPYCGIIQANYLKSNYLDKSTKNDKIPHVPEQEAKILYSDVESKQEIEAAPAEVPIVDFSESNIRTLYQAPPLGLGFAPENIGRIVGIKTPSVWSVIRREHIPSNLSLSDPDLARKRAEGVKRAFSQRHDEMISKIHNDQSVERRAKASRKYWTQDTARVTKQKQLMQNNLVDYRKREHEEALERKEAKRRSTRETRMQIAAFILDHDNFSQLPPRWQDVLTQRYTPSRQGHRPATHESIAKAMRNISRAGVQAIETRAVRELEKAGLPIKPGEIKPDEIDSVRRDSLEGRILDVLTSNEDAISINNLAEKAGSRSALAVYKTIPRLRAKLLKLDLRIVNLYDRGYKLVKVSQQQLER
jgi:hypothetical protein